MSDNGEGARSLSSHLSQAALKASQLEEEHKLYKRIAEEVSSSEGLVTAEQLTKLVAENEQLRRELGRYRKNAVYEDWFNKTFGVTLPVPNTWPFTTFPQGSPWCEKVVAGMQHGEILFAEHLLGKLAADNVAGAIVEFGTYYGHWLHVLATILEKHGWRRDVWGFDSFEGLPAPNPKLNPNCWTEGMYTAPLDVVKQRVQIERRPWLRLVKGWFKDTLFTEPAQSIGEIAYARIDGDLYESCVDCLKFLEGRLADGAIVVFDDWQLSCDIGEPRALKEWIEKGVPYRFEYLAFNMWAHLYVRVHKI
jgi:hypothetical protein